MKVITLIIGITIGILFIIIYIYEKIKNNKEIEKVLRRQEQELIELQTEERIKRTRDYINALEGHEKTIKINKKRRNYMFCKYCGAPLKAEKEDCEYCGMYAPYEDSEEESESIAWL